MSDREHSNPPQTQIEDHIKSQVQDTSTWVRLFFMILFMVIFYIVFAITGVVAIIQFVTRILTGKPLGSLQDFNAKLAEYARDLVAYITYASDAKPFPFKE